MSVSKGQREADTIVDEEKQMLKTASVVCDMFTKEICISVLCDIL